MQRSNTPLMSPDVRPDPRSNEGALRVGFVSVFPPDDPTVLSGMPFHMARALAAAGAEVTPLVGHVEPGRPTRAARRVRRVMGRPLPSSLRRTLGSAMQRTRERAQPIIETFAARSGRDLVGRSAALVETALRHHEIDVLFGCSISIPLAGVKTTLQIVYFTDITARLLNAGYPDFARRGKIYKLNCDDIERRALRRATTSVFASRWARSSALEHYGVPERRTRVVPMGANITPLDQQPARPAPRKDAPLRLCIVAASPVRKRLDLAIDATRQLVERGWNAELHYVGPETELTRAARHVKHVGRLALSDPADRNRLGRLLHEADLMLLPSLADAFGIAACEAAHFGCPSVVSRVGGLPEVVIDGETGLVLPVEAGAADWAHAIETLILQPGAYSSMSSAALRRARTRLSWNVWAREMMTILHAAAATR
ncbi:MAG: glycosyltransferase family 4 protein [Planctomycetota bacterium]